MYLSDVLCAGDCLDEMMACGEETANDNVRLDMNYDFLQLGTDHTSGCEDWPVKCKVFCHQYPFAR
jgi:hypothetical protein